MPVPSASRIQPTALPGTRAATIAPVLAAPTTSSVKPTLATRSIVSGQSSTALTTAAGTMQATATTHRTIGRRRFTAPPPARTRHRRGLALELERPARLEPVALHQAARRLGDEHAVAGAARRLLDAGGDVDRVADDAELEAAAAADRPDQHEPGVDADADAAALAEVRLDRRDDRARGGDAAVGVVGQRLGRAEHAEHAVAEELCSRAAVRLEHGHDDAEELVQQRHRLARRRAVGEAREVADVDEQHGDHRVLAVHRVLRSHSDTCAGCTVSRTTPRRSAPERVEVELVAQPPAERLERPRRVVAAPVEAPVDRALDPRPRRAEQRRHRQRRHRDRDVRRRPTAPARPAARAPRYAAPSVAVSAP